MKRIFKVILLTLIACSIRFIFSNVVNAQTYPTAFTNDEQQRILAVWDDYKNSFDTFTAFKDNNDYLVVNVFNASSGFKVYRTGGNNVFVSNQSIIGQGHWIKVYNNGTRQVNNFTGTTNNTSWSATVGNLGSFYYLYGNIPIYDSNQTSILWEPDTSIAPVIQNFEFTNVVNSMVDGEYFDIIVIANDYANTEIVFHINNGTLPGDTDEDYAKKYKYIILNSDSPYLMSTSEGSTAQGWKIPKFDLIPIYDNCVYNMWLTYGDNLSLSTETQTLTTSFSELGKSMAITDTQDATQDIANYLNNDQVDDADFELPEINVNDFTLSFFSSLVGSITDAFLDTTYDESITFDVRGTTYTIHSTEFDILTRVGLGVLKNFTALFWVFGIGYWIFCDARKRIMRLKEFNWTAMFSDDISVDML